MQNRDNFSCTATSWLRSVIAHCYCCQMISGRLFWAFIQHGIKRNNNAECIDLLQLHKRRSTWPECFGCRSLCESSEKWYCCTASFVNLWQTLLPKFIQTDVLTWTISIVIFMTSAANGIICDPLSKNPALPAKKKEFRVIGDFIQTGRFSAKLRLLHQPVTRGLDCIILNYKAWLCYYKDDISSNSQTGQWNRECVAMDIMVHVSKK